MFSPMIKEKVDVPAVCRNCQYYDWEYNEFSDTFFRYCIINLYFPVKKQTCKRQCPIQGEAEV